MIQIGVYVLIVICLLTGYTLAKMELTAKYNMKLHKIRHLLYREYYEKTRS